MPASTAPKKVSLTFERPWLRVAIAFAEFALFAALILFSVVAGGASVPIWVFPAAAVAALVLALGVCGVFVEPEQFASARAMKRYREQHGIPRGGSPVDAIR